MGRLMLTVSAAEWGGITHRPQHFVRRFARNGWTMVYLEPPATLLAPFKNRKTLSRWKNWLRGLRSAEEKVYLLAPPPVLPFAHKYRWINKINQWLTARTVRKAIRGMAHDGLDLYTFLPTVVDMLPYFNFDRVVYDCVDDHGAFTGLINPDVVRGMEKELMARSDVSFATAVKLLEDRKHWTPRLHLVPNGAEYEHFAREAQDAPPELAGIPCPIAGFVGGISDWIDVPLLTAVAGRMADVSFVFIGPVATDVAGLKALPNVTMLGPKAYQDLPRYVQRFDTCLIPFRINKLTESVNPIKMFEYLSAGRPVVSTPLPEVLAYRGVVEIAADEEAMVRAIGRTIAPGANEPAKVQARREVGRANSWDARWERAVQLIERKTDIAG